MSYFDGNDETLRQRSAWLLPMTAVTVVFVLSAAILLYYLVPSGDDLFREQIRPTSDSNRIALTVGGKTFHIPANYLEYASTRRGGARREVAMFARLPSLSGWSRWQADSFTDNSADSQILFLTLQQDHNNLTEADRLKRVYGDYILDMRGKPGPYGLTQYRFRPDTGYKGEDMFVGETETGPVVMRCVRISQTVPSPNCVRETLPVKGVALTYRFKRVHLAKWKKISTRVDKLIAGFLQP